MLAPRGSQCLSLILYFILSMAVNFPEGYTNSYPNTAVDAFHDFINGSFVKRDIELTESSFAWVWSGTLNVWFVGYFFGEVITPALTENYGRKKSLLISSFIAFFGALLNFCSILVDTPELFVAGRCLSSISSGLSFGVLILFLQEAPPTEFRGSASSMSETAFLLSTVLGMWCGMDIAYGKNLTVITGIPLIPAILNILLVIPLKETPKFLLLHLDDEPAAMEAIEYYHGTKGSDKVLQDIYLEQEQTKTLKMGTFEKLKSLLTKPHLRKAFFIGILTLQLVVSFWPITHLSTILLKDFVSSDTAQYVSLLYIAANFVTSLVGIFLVEKVGRRPLVLILGTINTLSLVFFIVFDNYRHYGTLSQVGIIASLVAFGASSGLGLASVAFFLPSELVSQHYRSLLQSATYAINTIMNLLFSGATLPLHTHIGSYCFIPLFIVPGILCLIYLYFNMPETRGREIHEIVRELINKEHEDPAEELMMPEVKRTEVKD